jgi:hypothetical protein
LVLRAFPFRIELLHLDEIIASHRRCFEKEQDILDPLHYLPLLAQRPGAFEHAKPIRRWRKQWSQGYEQLLAELQVSKPEGRGVREFLEVLKLHQKYPQRLVEQAVKQALDCGAAHLDGVMLCLRQLLAHEPPARALDLGSLPELNQVGAQPVDLNQYNQLLGAR